MQSLRFQGTIFAVSWFTRLLRKILPVDSSDDCGYGPFKLGPDHEFTPACRLHDHDFKLAHEQKAEKSIDQADADLFWRWALIAHNQSNAQKRCELMMEICKLWPLARAGGVILWDGPEKDLPPWNG